MKPVIGWLRKRVLISSKYLDYILCIENYFRPCLNNIRQTIECLKKLGFIINFNKSMIVPAQSRKHLGFIIDSKKYRLELTKEKRTSLRKSVELIIKNKCKIRNLTKLIGSLIAACPAIAYGPLYSKELERAKTTGILIRLWKFLNM